LPVRVIHCPQSFGIVIKNGEFKLSYSGDTRPSLSFGKSAKDSDLMIHEATFNDEEKSKAERYRHSTIE
jgi:ribonuclease Z